MRAITHACRRALYASQTGEVLLVLLELSHPQMATPIRVTSDGVDTVVAGVVYQHFPFRVTWPDDTDDTPPRAELAIDAVDRSIVRSVRQLSGSPIQVSMRVVMASDPTVVEAGPCVFDMRDVEYSAFEVSGKLEYADVANEDFPLPKFDPSTTPGLF